MNSESQTVDRFVTTEEAGLPMPAAKSANLKAKAGKKRTAAPKASSFPAQAKNDFPFDIYERNGKPFYTKLEKRYKNKQGQNPLSPYELYLLQKHFPGQEKKFNDAPKQGRGARSLRGPGLISLTQLEDEAPALISKPLVFRRKASTVL